MAAPGIPSVPTIPGGTPSVPILHGGTPPSVNPGQDFASELTGANRDAFVALNALFTTYGLGTLAPKIFSYIQNGYSSDTITLLLQQTPEYKQRFIGNDARQKAGLSVLSPADYINTENAYKQIMMSAGLPSGFYDQPSDLASWIGKDVSPTEIQSRVDLASQATTLASPAYKQALNQMGIDDSHLVSYFLDPAKALPAIQKAAATAAIGSQAIQQGLSFDTNYAGQLATEGITQQQAQQGYSQIAQALPTLGQLGQRYGYQFGQRQAEQAVFENDADVLAQEKRITGQEAGMFAGNTGGAAQGLEQSEVWH